MDFKKFVESKDMSFNENEFKKDLIYIKLMIKSEIARNLWGSEYYYQIRISGDKKVQDAVQHFSQAAKIAGLTFDGQF